jgi:hypothetical protein
MHLTPQKELAAKQVEGRAFCYMSPEGQPFFMCVESSKQILWILWITMLINTKSVVFPDLQHENLYW